jgi:hypothetical protein
MAVIQINKLCILFNILIYYLLRKILKKKIFTNYRNES